LGAAQRRRGVFVLLLSVSPRLRGQPAKDFIVAALALLFYMVCTHPHVEAQVTSPCAAPPPSAASTPCSTLTRSSPAAQVLPPRRDCSGRPQFEEKEAVGEDALPDGTKVAKALGSSSA
jgi:hypothetical protein